MLELLRAGPATASMLARELGESSGATSYHLRELHKAGFVDDDPEHASRRERWWKRVPRFLVSTAPAADDAEYDAALSQLRSVIVERDEDALARYFATVDDEPPDWQGASFLGGWTLFATPDEIRRLSAILFEEIGKLHRHPADRTADARAVHVSYRALVQPERSE
jgi:DNA-binding transcriptional ArsR family regulator